MKFKFTDADYLNTKEKIQAASSRFVGLNGKCKHDLLAFDTETNGLVFFNNVVIGFSLSTSRDDGVYIPLLEWRPKQDSFKVRTRKGEKVEMFEEGCLVDVWTGKEYPEFVTPKEYSPPGFVVQLLKDWTEGAQLIMHNGPFDCNMVLYNMNLDLSPQLFCDTQLLKHVIDENTRHGLKETAELWKDRLGFNPEEDARKEQKELGRSVIRNGGTFNQKTKHVWRGDPWMVAKYGASDTALTFGLFEVGMQLFEERFSQNHIKWFYEDEVMPLCREVVIPMRFGGVYADIPYFKELQAETEDMMNQLEDNAIREMGDLLQDFSIGDSMEDSVSNKRLVEEIMELEGLEYPTQFDKKDGKPKPSLARKAVEEANRKEPHWLWDFVLGTGVLKYSEERVHEIKLKIYREKLGRRYRFNINSDDHLRWLLIDKLGNDPYAYPQTDSATKDNAIPSMAAEVLKDHFLKRYPFIYPIMKYRKLGKMMSSYISPAIALNNNGWLHMDMKQSGTISGRFSCSGGFNLQTLPKVEELERCKKCESKNVDIDQMIRLMANITCKDCGHREEDVITPSAIKRGFINPKGYKIINADYASLEPRCFAFMSGDKKLKEVYLKNLDLYSKVYCDMLDKEGKYSPDPKAENFLKKLNKEARDIIKLIVLGIPYGALDPQVANLMGLKKTILRVNKSTGLEEEVEVPDVKKGKYYRELYLSTYKDLTKYMERQEWDAIQNGYVETIIGRRRHFLYTKKVFKLLKELGVSYREFYEAAYKSVEGDGGDGSKDLNLTREGLVKFCDIFQKDLAEVIEAGGWAYVRNLFRNELNNAKNYPIQALAAHITNKATLDVTRLFRDYGIDGYVSLQVHDEVTCYVQEHQAEAAAELLKLAMEQNQFSLKLDVPMEAVPVICDNLKDSK